MSQLADNATAVLFHKALHGIALATANGASPRDIAAALVVMAMAVDPDGFDAVDDGSYPAEDIAASRSLRDRLLQAGILRHPPADTMPAAEIPGAGPSA